MKKLIINADDFGFCPAVDAGILDAHEKGAITDFSFMVKEETFSSSLELLEEKGIKACGIHLNITSGHSVRTGKRFPDLPGLMKEIMLNRESRREVKQEIESQFHMMLNAGITVSHIDSHQNFHLLPFLFYYILKTADVLGLSVPVRIPFENPLTIGVINAARISALDLLSVLNLRKTLQRKVRVVGQSYFNNPDRESVLESVQKSICLSRHEVFEFPMHPGYCSSECEAVCGDSYTRQRADEFDTVVNNKGYFQKSGIDLISFADINGLQGCSVEKSNNS